MFGISTDLSPIPHPLHSNRKGKLPIHLKPHTKKNSLSLRMGVFYSVIDILQQNLRVCEPGFTQRLNGI